MVTIRRKKGKNLAMVMMIYLNHSNVKRKGYQSSVLHQDVKKKITLVKVMGQMQEKKKQLLVDPWTKKKANLGQNDGYIYKEKANSFLKH